jgi:hypothetical protein
MLNYVGRYAVFTVNFKEILKLIVCSKIMSTNLQNKTKYKIYS